MRFHCLSSSFDQDQCRPFRRLRLIAPVQATIRDNVMTAPEKLYLAVVLVTFVAFIGTLAYASMNYEAFKRAKGG